MKVSPTANYTVRVLRQEWEEIPEVARLYTGVFAVALNYTVDIGFVPDVSSLAPPWNPAALPSNLDDVATPELARLGTALFSSYVVTPNPALAGTEDGFTWPDEESPPSGVVFYVTSEEFDRYAVDLDRLTAVAGNLHSQVRVADLRDYEVVRFLEERVVASPRLKPRHAVLLGQDR